MMGSLGEGMVDCWFWVVDGKRLIMKGGLSVSDGGDGLLYV